MVRFSSRIRWSLQPSPIAQAVRQQQGRYLDLSQSNPTVAGIQYPAGIPNLLADPRGLRYDPSAAGLIFAREAVSAYYECVVDPSHILLTASTSEAYSYVFRALCDAGDEVLVPRPSYPLFEFLAELDLVRAVHYPMHYDHGWYIDLDALKSAITDRTRAIVFVNPNNPTGSFLKASEYEFMAALCDRRGLALIVDEVFRDYAFRPDEGRVETVSSRADVLTFTLSGLSKIAALPQVKLGWIAVSGPDGVREEALRRLELIADTFLSVSTPAQYALPALLDSRIFARNQIRERTAGNLRLLLTLAAGGPARVLEPEAGWYASLQVPKIFTEEEWVLHLLQDAGVLVQPGFFYDFDSEAFLILSLLTEPEIFAEGAKRTILAAKGQIAHA